MQRPGHRADIDGLRCLAVTLVVLYHAGLPGLSGGFVGVDVFLVISGYLITGLLIDEHARAGRVSLAAFWSRRVRRIIPALAVVVTATVLVGSVVLLPWEFDSLLHSARATVLSLANVHFRDAGGGYFAADVEQEPLLHMWSLGVEEQFYLALPLVAVAALTIGRRALAGAIAVLGIGSLVWASLTVAGDPQAAFYLPQHRAWELLIGSALALARPSLRRIPNPVARPMVWAGLAAVVGAAVTFSSDTTFPGPSALLPTLGTAAVIAAGVADRPGTIAAPMLSSRPAQWIGAWSYSWYLWHWPALVLVRQHLRSESLPRDLLVIVCSLGLAALSWRYVEEPFRRAGSRSTSTTRRTLAIGATALAVMVAATTVVISRDGDAVTRPTLPTGPTDTSSATTSEPISGWPDDVDWSAASRLDLIEASRAIPDVPCTGSEPVVPFQDGCELRSGERYLVLVGDSHAEHLAAPLLQLADARGWGMVVASFNACPLLPGVEVTFGDEVLPACTDWSEAVLADITAHADRVAVVVSSARGGLYLPGTPRASGPMWETQVYGADTPEATGELWEAGMVRYAELLTGLGIPLVWVHDVVEFPEWPSECLPYRTVPDCSVTRVEADRYRDPIFTAERDALASRSEAAVLDPFEVLCTASSCPPARGEVILYRDGNHLTLEGAALLRPGLDEALRRVVAG